ncbi:glycosyltransferase [Rhodococcus sp. X156]|uniref:glycosyltransferase n=1 Tax=Rhodococcus sp. X156 TaxID=2499145 RepID=UPI000FDBBA66|nr:glycosyltransferase [Rhodococcus sp. X156]
MVLNQESGTSLLGGESNPAVQPGQTATRMVAQRCPFLGPSTVVAEALYADTVSGRARRARQEIRLEPETVVSLNTYFGRFPASYWQRWTPVTEVRLTAWASGAGRVSVLASDMDGDPRTVATADVVEDGPLEMLLAIDRFVDGGALWAELSTGPDVLVVRDMQWEVVPPRPVRRAAVVICTHNRPDDCVNILEALAGDAEADAWTEGVYVVDQGTDKVVDNPRFAAAAAALDERLTYLQQPNLGGAGGFTRGMYEVAGKGGAGHANVIFMDDDVRCEPDVVVRLNAFACCTVEPTIVGAQMLHLLHPHRLHIGAEHADFEAVRAGIASQHSPVNSDMTLHNQDRRVDGTYNGWWTCLIPAEVVAAIGYPLPVFIQWDDIEYGYRARAAGFATVNLPGAGLWHVDFSWKDRDEWPRYFHVRNALIGAALHTGFDRKRAVQNLWREISQDVLGMQYGLALTRIRGMEDFLRGPQVLADGGAAALAAVRRERALFDETRRQPAAQLDGLRAADVSIAELPPEPSRENLTFARRIVDQVRGRSIASPAGVPARDAHWWHVARFETAVVTDASQEGVHVRRQDPVARRDLLARLTRVCYQLYREGPDVAQRYRDALPELTSRENWQRLFSGS